ncbi:unnamed protein product [Pelagomonas calceolata]|uniref:SnoaL-like domain-containing protein n=1 Tax=Pelagomonas calceolata TaxID=35677 RepID=A0A7S4A516_9STRA|nr:unnamed protein product [Pelagomonas calceolata]|mmetsp:Transcript_5779/g.16212  ORF Transcript_5779/g.16212 Transcript_5779/m.16212 type:complete len:369 (+) Transcript_5779:139-1245(+)
MRIYAIIALAGVVTAYVPSPPQRETKRNVVVAAQSTLERPVLQATVEDQTERNNVLNLPESEKITLETPLEAGRRGPSEFELNLGRAIDALRSDVPAFADRELSWDIYADNVQLADPSGVQTRGLQNYKQFFGVIRMFRRVMIDKVDITFKLRYDWSKKIIKVTWYSKWYARGSSKAAYVDATSAFHLDEQGKIFKHVVDRVQVGGRPLSPPYSVGWLAFREYVLAGLDGPRPAAVPSFGFEASDIGQDALVLMSAMSASSDVAQDAPLVMSASDGESEAPPPSKKKAPRNKEKKQKRKLLPGQCEGMWDCDSPMECCDFVMFKMCCRGGLGIPAFLEPAPVLVPIPVPVERGPPGMPGGRGGGVPPY